jgi:hypothetical protein
VYILHIYKLSFVIKYPNNFQFFFNHSTAKMNCGRLGRSFNINIWKVKLRQNAKRLASNELNPLNRQSLINFDKEWIVSTSTYYANLSTGRIPEQYLHADIHLIKTNQECTCTISIMISIVYSKVVFSFFYYCFFSFSDGNVFSNGHLSLGTFCSRWFRTLLFKVPEVI